MLSTYISAERDIPARKAASFDVIGLEIAQHVVDGNHRAVIVPLRARELVALDGIADQSLFAYNVRGPLGKTKVNKDIIKTLEDKSKHKIFPLFHNGITIIAKSINITKEAITIEDYHVVNGCQSISTLYHNKKLLTDDLSVLTKIIQMNPAADDAKLITEYSNNQNGVRPRDFKSNHQIQIRLQLEFRKYFKDEFSFEIKRGEIPDAGEPITNEEAGLLLMAFDLKEPWATHRKYEIFEDKHGALFGRPEVTADRIVFLKTIMSAIESRLPKLKNDLLGKYVLTKYMILYVVKCYFEGDKKFEEISDNPSKFVRKPELRARLAKCVGAFLDEIIVDLNLETKDVGKDFDYRGNLRDATWIKKLSDNLVREYEKQKERGKSPTFTQAWEASVKEQV